MNVLVTGANGFVGQALVARLQRDGGNVLGSVRCNPGVHQIATGDINESTDWSQAVIGREVVIHTAALVHQMNQSGMQSWADFHRINTVGTIRLANQAAEAGVKRFIFLSSVKTMGETGHFQSGDPCRPKDSYGLSKYEAELGLKKLADTSAIEVTILRLPLVYGVGVGANFLRLIELVDKEIPLPFGKVHNARSLLSLTNLVDVTCACMNHPAAGNKTFLVSDGEDVSTPDLIRAIAKALGRKVCLPPVPVGLMCAVATLLGKRAVAERLFGSLTLDSEPLRRELGWVPPFTLQQSLNETGAWYLNHSRRKPI